METVCAHCGARWDMWFLKNLSARDYTNTVGGYGCPTCGFDHGSSTGPFRISELRAMLSEDS